MPTQADAPVVLFFCTGVGIYNRGIETFFREAFDGLHPLLPQHGVRAVFYKGGGKDVPPDEHRLWCLPRTGTPAKLLGKMIRRSSYVVEQMTFLPGLKKAILRERPDVVYYSDNNAAMRLFRWRKKSGVPFRLLYSNGAPLRPPFGMIDFVQQVAPIYYEEAIAARESAERQMLVPYGIRVPAGSPIYDPAAVPAIRRELGLPVDRKIVLSVGWIAHKLKRMDYTIREIAALPRPRPFLMMLGNINEESPPIIALAKELLGEDNFAARSVPYEQVAAYYRAADVFALASIQEGFGRVYLEALMHGLPAVVNENPVTRFVLDDQAVFADLTKPGSMAAALPDILARPRTPGDMANRRESVRRRFDWEVLAPKYAEMFKRCANVSMLS